MEPMSEGDALDYFKIPLWDERVMGLAGTDVDEVVLQWAYYIAKMQKNDH